MTEHVEGLGKLAADAPGLEIVTEGELLQETGRDTWMRSLMQARASGREPRAGAVLRPSNTAELSAALRWAGETGTPVLPYGYGSGVCGGVLASAGSVVVDLRRMDAVLNIDDVSLRATVQAGMRGSDFEAALNERGLTMGHCPQSIEISSVGGWCATRASGQFSTLYGNIEDMLLGCEFVLPGGTVLRLASSTRSATGPDLKHMLMGSEGTLGVFSELTFRVHPLPDCKRGQAFTVPDFAAGVESLRLIMRGGWRPAVTRLYDAAEAGRHFAGMAEGAPALLFLSEGPESLVQAESAAIAAIVEAQGGTPRGEEPVLSWMEHRNQVPTFDSLLDQGLVVDTIEVAIAWDRLSALYDDVSKKGGEIEDMLLMSGHVSHCYTHGANIYFTFVASQPDLERGLEIYDRAWETTMRAVHEAGGTIAHHHGIGRVRRGWLKAELGEGVELLRALKDSLDPAGIMNPGVLLEPAE